MSASASSRGLPTSNPTNWPRSAEVWANGLASHTSGVPVPEGAYCTTESNMSDHQRDRSGYPAMEEELHRRRPRRGKSTPEKRRRRRESHSDQLTLDQSARLLKVSRSTFDRYFTIFHLRGYRRWRRAPLRFKISDLRRLQQSMPDPEEWEGLASEVDEDGKEAARRGVA